ncbi:tetratricopeptide repeat protein, partial [Staphylococcus aureus]|uniref:tetratricopeptide repeat protein n=1 Tax=Staphylococcus aureus TaxID=1280 RepID=UPI002264CBCF
MRKCGRPDKAIISFHYALQLCPENTAARTNYGDELVFNCKFEEADEEYEHVIKLKPDDPSARFSRGMVQL